MRVYDVIIVGGRPAGATLAARLGRRGLNVLIVDRANFPSLPAVPSSPVIHAGGMRILDELGIDESSYGQSDAKMQALGIQFDTHFHTLMTVPSVLGRNYVYGIDRQHFDFVLWQHLARFPSITRLDGFAVTELLRNEENQVVGIVGASRGCETQEFRANCVVGADGRFSLVARKAGAKVQKEDSVHVSTVYYANWEGVIPFFEGPLSGHIYTTGRGLDVPMFCMPGGLTNINLHMRADRVDIAGDAQGYYEQVLRAQPCVWNRLKSARQVSAVVGIKRVGNGYRQASGKGWVLVGDALHYKDPVDAQGIYDALLEARLLDVALAAWQNGEQSFANAMADYEKAVHAATGTMFEQTLARLRRELYSEPPLFMIKTVLRWLMCDPAYQHRFMHYLCRVLPNDQLMTPALFGKAMLRGIVRDLQRLLH